jgi:RPA family protein
VEPLNTLKSRVVDPNPDLYVFWGGLQDPDPSLFVRIRTCIRIQILP